MKNYSKKILSLSLVLMIMLSLTSVSLFADSCAPFQVYNSGSPYCENSWCGIWDTTELFQKLYLKRQCLRKDSTTYWEYDVEVRTLDCGC